MTTAEVIIVGAGPVGTVAAYYLARQGIEVILLEATPNCMADMRASTIHPPTLEMMRDLDIADELVNQGLKAPIYQYRDRDTDEYIEFDLSELDKHTTFPYRLQCEQFKIARLLSARLDACPNADVRFNNRVLGVRQDEDKVVVDVETRVAVEQVSAKYLVAADGANSIIRKWLALEFDGFTYPENFLTLSTDTPIEKYIDNLCYVNYIAHPKEWVVLLRVPTAWRILVPANGDEERLLSDGYKTELFERLIGFGDNVVTNHRTLYRVHQRVVKKYNHGRILLVGDAAHLNNPLGGFGMNSGIHDAWCVGGKLVDILKNGAQAASLLEAFDAERRAIMLEFIQTQTIRNKKMMETPPEEAVGNHLAELREIKQDDNRRVEYLLKQAMLGGRLEQG